MSWYRLSVNDFKNCLIQLSHAEKNQFTYITTFSSTNQRVLVVDHMEGYICKAKCDRLLCTAKIMHPTLFSLTSMTQEQPLTCRSRISCSYE